jgi:hypothetical protein
MRGGFSFVLLVVVPPAKEKLMIARFNQWTLVALIGAAMLLNSGRAQAQDAAPTWEAVIPDASLCQAQPRTVDELVALFANATPSATTTVPDRIEVPARHSPTRSLPQRMKPSPA